MAHKNTPEMVFQHIDMHGGDKTVCWEWKGKVNAKDGRPYFTVSGKRRPAYCYTLELYHGQLQTKGQVARHSCDNKLCCNPHHLSFGSHQDNMNDMKERERHGLPRIVVRAIQKLLTQGRSEKSIAELYGVSREAVSAIKTGRNHKDTGDPKTSESNKE
jgi:hypothetical protein